MDGTAEGRGKYGGSGFARMTNLEDSPHRVHCTGVDVNMALE